MAFIGLDHHKKKRIPENIGSFDENSLLKSGKEHAFLRDDHDYLGSMDRPTSLLSLEITSFSVASPEHSLPVSFILYHI